MEYQYDVDALQALVTRLTVLRDGFGDKRQELDSYLSDVGDAGIAEELRKFSASWEKRKADIDQLISGAITLASDAAVAYRSQERQLVQGFAGGDQ